MNYRNIYRALSIKNAINVLMTIYQSCQIEQYLSFSDIEESLKIEKHSLRKITNRLSSCGLIVSTKDTNGADGRSRVYVVSNANICEKIKELTVELSN